MMELLRFTATVAPQRRDLLGVELPTASAGRLGTRGQAPVIADVNGIEFRTTVFPTGDGRHSLLLAARLRSRLGVKAGDRVSVALRPAPPRPPAQVPPDLRDALARSESAARAWRLLTPPAQQVAARWIGGARDSEVRAWRIADVLRRAERYARGEGPFYPRGEDQRLLARPPTGRPRRR